MSETDQILSEGVLIEFGAITRPALRRRKLLGCLGCRWARTEMNEGNPKAYGFEIMKCSKLPSSAVYPLLHQLEETGVVVRVAEDIDPVTEGRPPRNYVTPANNELGQALASAIVPSAICHLDR